MIQRIVSGERVGTLFFAAPLDAAPAPVTNAADARLCRAQKYAFGTQTRRLSLPFI